MTIGRTLAGGPLAIPLVSLALGAAIAVPWRAALGWPGVLALGGGCALAFGLLVALGEIRFARRFAAERAHFAPEGLLCDGRAAHPDGIRSTAGWLFLTGERLRFISSRGAEEPYRVEVRFADLATAAPARLGLLSRGIELVTKGQLKYRFGVPDPARWCEVLAANGIRPPLGDEPPPSS